MLKKKIEKATNTIGTICLFISIFFLHIEYFFSPPKIAFTESQGFHIIA